MNHLLRNTETQRFFIFLFSVSLCLCGLISVKAQDYPKEIRGYKVQKTKISVKNKNDNESKKDDAEAYIELGEPTVEDVSVTGLTLEIPAEILSTNQSGKVDFLTFKDFRVNGLNVSIEEYKQSFEFEKNKAKALPEPLKIFVGIGQTLRGAIGEMRNSKEEWTVTGTIFVFGKFKKFGFNFKRVVPVEVNIKIKNPLKNK
jgi:hypothetical protein